MADDMPINDAPTDETEVAFFFGQKDDDTTFGLRKYLASQVPHAVGFTGTDKGKMWTVDASGNVATVAPGIDGQVVGFTSGLPVAMEMPQTMRYVASTTASGAASIEFTTGFGSDYDEYIFVFSGIYASVSTANLQMLISENGGSSYHATNYFDQIFYGNNTTPTSDQAPTNTCFKLSQQLGTTAAVGLYGRLHMFVDTTRTSTQGQITHPFYTATYNIILLSGGSRATTARANAVKFQMSSGNISGTIRQYRVKDS